MLLYFPNQWTEGEVLSSTPEGIPLPWWKHLWDEPSTHTPKHSTELYLGSLQLLRVLKQKRIPKIAWNWPKRPSGSIQENLDTLLVHRVNFCHHFRPSFFSSKVFFPKCFLFLYFEDYAEVEFYASRRELMNHGKWSWQRIGMFFTLLFSASTE